MATAGGQLTCLLPGSTLALSFPFCLAVLASCAPSNHVLPRGWLWDTCLRASLHPCDLPLFMPHSLCVQFPVHYLIVGGEVSLDIGLSFGTPQRRSSRNGKVCEEGTGLTDSSETAHAPSAGPRKGAAPAVGLGFPKRRMPLVLPCLKSVPMNSKNVSWRCSKARERQPPA